MYRYDMLATPQGTLRPDLALARKQRCEMNATKLNRAAAVPDGSSHFFSRISFSKKLRKVEKILKKIEIMENFLKKIEKMPIF